MKYENKEKKELAKEERRQQDMTRFKLYEESESFDEYLANITVHGVAKKKMLDIFWWHYHFKDTPKLALLALFGSFFVVNMLLVFAIRLLLVSGPVNVTGASVFLCCLVSTVFGIGMTGMVCSIVDRAYDSIRCDVERERNKEKYKSYGSISNALSSIAASVNNLTVSLSC